MKKNKLSIVLSIVFSVCLFVGCFANGQAVVIANAVTHPSTDYSNLQFSNPQNEFNPQNESNSQNDSVSQIEANSQNDSTSQIEANSQNDSTSQNESNNLTNNDETIIYFTNDVHGYFTNVNQSGGGMSYATLRGLKDKSQAEGKTTYLVDAGDHVSGSSYANFSSGNDVMNITSKVEYDFRVPGNHEFDYGTSKFFNEFLKQAQYYACNFYKGTPTQRGENLLSPYKIVEGANGEKIALIGVMTPETISATAPGFFQDDKGNWVMYIDSSIAPAKNAMYDIVNETISDVKKTYGENTICIGVGHLGNDDGTTQAGNDSTTLIKNTSGLDAFIDGHSHKIYNNKVEDSSGKEVILAQAASGLNSADKTETTGMNRIGKMTIKKSAEGDSSVNVEILDKDNDEIKSVLSPTSETAVDVANLEKEVIEKVDNSLKQEVAQNEIVMDASSSTQRTKANNLGDLIADQLLYYAKNFKDSKGEIVGADAAIINGGGIRNDLPIGVVTLKSCLDILPFVNQVAVCEVTGQKILDALEYSVSQYPGAFGGFLHVAGLQFSFDDQIPSTVQTDGLVWVGPPTGQYRVHSVQIYDKDKEDYVPLDLNKTYKIAGNDYMLANYGNGYEMFKGSTRYAYDNVLIYQSLSKYLAAFKTDASSNANLPVISTANNPINDEKGYINYKIDYENPDGAKRITISPYTPEPDPKPTPADDTTNGNEQLSATSASTGDQAYIQAVLLMIILSTLILVGKSKRMMNNTRNYPQDY